MIAHKDLKEKEFLTKALPLGQCIQSNDPRISIK